MKQENFDRATEIQDLIFGLRTHLNHLNMGFQYGYMLPEKPRKQYEDEDGDEEEEPVKGKGKPSYMKSTPKPAPIYMKSSLYFAVKHGEKIVVYDEFLPEGDRQAFMEMYHMKVMRKIAQLEQEFAQL